MSRDPLQSKRSAVLSTPLGKDTLVFVRLDASEGLSELFEYRIEAISTRENLDFDRALGQQCSVRIGIAEQSMGRVTREKVRHFTGVLVEAQWIGMRDTYYAYRLVLRPWLWLLGQTTDCRIFHDQPVETIIETVLRESGLGEFRMEAGGHPVLEHCVQYRESKLNFVSRLMEEYGIGYHFEHGDGQHTLVLTDRNSSFKPIPKTETLPFVPLGGQSRHEYEHLHHWIVERRFRTGRVAYRDYDYEKPDADMNAEERASERYTSSDLEVYDYPGRYKEKEDGRTLARVRLEAEQSFDRRRFASGDAVTLYPGGSFTLEGHAAESENASFVVVRATHSFTNQSYRSGATGPGDHDYSGQYEFQPKERPFKPAAVTPKPTIYGPQTARVVGAAGEEIDVDDEGRILVCFHWDRKTEHKYRVRVAQVWAGKNWGGSFIPRIGQEVIVEFLEGDVDRPLVTGTVYNGKNTMPFGTKTKKTINGIKSDSTKGGNGYNEFVFDDEKRSEKVKLRAEKDLDTLVRHAETREIGEVFPTPNGQASRSTTLKNGDDDLHVQSGSQNVKVARVITMEAGDKIVLKVGNSTIVMDPTSITMKSTFITIKADAELKASAPMTEVKGDTTLILQGGVVKIN